MESFKISTSYFAKMRKFPENAIAISIALFPPKGMNIVSIPELYPTKEILQKYKSDNDCNAYTEAYNKIVLNNLNPTLIINKIKNIAEANGKNEAIRVCYEKSSDFCHRHLVSEWFRNNGCPCEEWTED